MLRLMNQEKKRKRKKGHIKTIKEEMQDEIHQEIIDIKYQAHLKRLADAIQMEMKGCNY